MILMVSRISENNMPSREANNQSSHQNWKHTDKTINETYSVRIKKYDVLF